MKILIFALIPCIALLTFTANVKAGGPFSVNSNGVPFKWDTSQFVPFTPDQGSLGTLSNDAAVQMTNELFQIWQDVPSASITFQQQGQLSQDITRRDILSFLDSLPSLGISPIIFDNNGRITNAIFGFGASLVTVGFAGPCNLDSSSGLILQSSAVMNGRFLDGRLRPHDITLSEFRLAFAHEFGHYIGLDHTQIDLDLFLINHPSTLPLMFPILVDGADSTLKVDDIASVSTLYPTPLFNTTTGTIQGRVFLPDGTTQFQGANVIAREISNPRIQAVSSVSGFLHSGNSGFNNFGSNDPELLGFYKIRGLKPGDYTIEIESIYADFVAGSSVGPVSPPKRLPGMPEFFDLNESDSDNPSCIAEISVSAEQIVDDVNIIINSPGTAGQTVNEQEPNNGISNAQLVPIPSTVNGSASSGDVGIIIDNGDDIEDLYSITLDTDQALRIYLSMQNNSADLDLFLLDENGNVLQDSTASNGEDELIGPIDLQSGTFFIGVSSFGRNPSSEYTLDITGECNE